MGAKFLCKHFCIFQRSISNYEILHACINYDMPTLLVCPKEHHAEAQKLIGGDVPDIVSLVDAADLSDAAHKILD